VGTGKNGAVGRQLLTLFNVGAIRELTDGQLLERFATGRGEGAELAFAALVERHGSMVLRVARGVLDDPNDAQDAFQATFLVLVSKARGLWVRDSLGPWLHQVAYRTAKCLRANAERRRRLEKRAAPVEEASQPPGAVDDLARVLLEEVDRLPERYRAPVVLCDLEGRTHEQAARALGWPVGTVKSRQARARQRLRDRLTRRGVAPGLAPLAAWPAIEASLPAFLVDQTTVAAVRFVASRAIVPGTAAALAREVIRSMIILRWTKSTTLLLALGAAGSGAGLIAQDQKGKPGDVPKPVERAQAAPVADPSVIEVKPGKLSLTLAERGFVEASIRRDMVCQVEGSTTIIMIKPEGTMVKQGDVVAELDSAALRDMLINQKITTQQAEAAFKQARLVREVAEYAVKEYTQGLLPQDRATLKGKVSLARDRIEKGKERLERAQVARKRLDEAIARRVGGETASDIAAELTIDDLLDKIKLDIQSSELDLKSAEAEQKVLEDYTSQKMTKSLQSDVEKAKADELSKQSSWSLELSKEKKLERQIAACVLRAPGDGLIVYANDPGRAGGQNRIQIEEGATVRERQKILSVIDLAAPMRINARVREPMVDRITVGHPVKIKVDAYSNEVFTGTVQSVAPMADPNIIFATNEKIYPTIIQIKDGIPNLRPGMSARVQILLDEVDDVLHVPSSCVFYSDKVDKSGNPEHFFVAVKTPGGVVEWRELTFGRGDQQVLEVKSGLKPGDLVVRDPKAEMGLDMTGKHRPPVHPAFKPIEF
jgi:HlyD family secretion protein